MIVRSHLASSVFLVLAISAMPMAAGAQFSRVRDLNPGAGNASPVLSSLAADDGRLLFAASDGTDTHLYKTDGTDAGTVMVRVAPSGAELPYLFGGRFSPALVNNKVLFVMRTSATGHELFSTDGTAAGTVLVKDLAAGPAGAFHTETDGSPAFLPAVANNVGYFAAKVAATGTELHRTDGTSGGTVLLKDIRAGADGSNPVRFSKVGSRVVFFANDGTNGEEPWVTDGTSGGTVMLRDVFPGAGSSTVAEPAAPGVVVNNILYFVANNSANGPEPWRTDGTPGGTYLLKDIATGAGGTPTASGIERFAPYRNQVLFVAYSPAQGREMWRSDGSVAETVLLRDIFPGQFGSEPLLPLRDVPYATGEFLYFAADNGALGSELWRTDGTTAGTSLVKDINTRGSAASRPREFIRAAGTTLFSANDGFLGYELFRTDGTAAGTVRVRDIFLGDSGSGPISSEPPFLENGYPTTSSLFFFARNGFMSDGTTVTDGFEPWVTSGTFDTTELLQNIAPNSTSMYLLTPSTNPVPRYVESAGRLYFVATDGTSGYELYSAPLSTFGISECAGCLQPDSNSIGVDGGAGRTLLVLSQGCSWTAAPDQSWVTLTSAAGGSGTAPLNYSVTPNFLSTARTATITINGGIRHTITQAPFVSNVRFTVTAPNGGELLDRGRTVTIRWTSSSYAGPVRIDLFAGSAQRLTIAGSTANDGKFDWSVPTTLPLAKNYRIRVSKPDDENLSDRSDRDFTVRSVELGLRMTSPSGGAYRGGQRLTVRWASARDAGRRVKLELIKGESVVTLIATDSANDGYQVVKLPSRLAAGVDYKFRVSSLSTDAVGETAAAFEVKVR